ncbi:MAG: ABC transporter substrate-binding protein [Candidatus Eiseniibacteriota bacterium]
MTFSLRISRGSSERPFASASASAPALALLAILLLPLVFAGCAKKGSASGSAPGGGNPISGGELVFARGHDSVRLDPGHETDGESFKVIDNIYENLCTYADTTTDILPELAYRWDISTDGLVYTFHLRPDVKFHDGTPLNAEAVLFSLDRQRDKKPPHPFHSVGGPYTYWQSMSMDEIVKDIQAVDDSTVVITLHRRNAPFLANLAMGFAAIVSPTAARQHGEDFFKRPVGTGPFRFVEWVKDERIVLERNPDYWGPKAYLDRVVFRSIPENTVRLLALETGEVMGMDGINAELAKRLEQNQAFTLLQQPGMNVGYLAMHCDKPPFDKLLVRQAVNYAVNREAIVKGLYGGFGAPAVNAVPPTLWGYNRSVQPYPYDPAKAKELLAQAGFPQGFKTQLYAMSGPRPYMPDPLKVAEAIQADLKNVGIDATLKTLEWGTYLDEVQHGKHRMCLLGWVGDNGDPDNFLYVLLDKESTRVPAQNVAFWRNDRVHELLVGAQEETDQAARATAYEEVQQIAHDEAPWVPLAHMTQLIAFRKGIHGYPMHPTGKIRFRTVWIEPGA